MNNNSVSKILSAAGRLLGRILLYLWCIFSVFTFAWMIITSFKTNRELFKSAWGLPKVWQVSNYQDVFQSYKLGKNFLNSLIIVAVSVTLIDIISAPAAYALTRGKFRWVDKVGRLFTLGMGVPFQLMLIPLYFLMYSLGFNGGKVPLVIVYVALSLPFTIFLMEGFFSGLPRALEEATYIDGCTPVKSFFHVMLPLGRPGIITATIFNFIGLWNEFMLALTFIKDSKDAPLSIGLYSMQGSLQITGDWTTLFSALVIVTVPTLLIYLCLSKQIIAGLTMGAVKE